MSMRLGLREWGAAELGAGLGAIFGPSRHAAREAALADWFGRQFGAAALPLNSGSSALQLALECLAARAPQRREVLLPALACPALTRVLQRCGLEPRYTDIGPDLNTPMQALAEAIGTRTLAVIMVHAYGHPADAPAIQALCRAQGVALLDDAAQRIDPAAGPGRFGDFAVFSFAQSKNVVSGVDGSGGLLLVHAREHLPAVEARWRQLTEAPRRRSAWLEFTLQPHLPTAAYHLGRWRQRGRAKGQGPGLHRIAGIDAALALAQLASLEPRRRRRLALLHAWRMALDAAGIEAPQLRPGQDDYLARLMVRLPAARRQACRDALAALGIATRLPYPLPAALPPGACPQARRLAAELLELPLPGRWQAADIDAAAQSLARFGAGTEPTTQEGAMACNITGN